ncbi:esterase FE4-like isoform X2 [Melitaea cinxia]|uniref:esterase FE4-like isoform X2 n=1 Tax=Melitaea cinxia TaxID=113334 RepID=UPI001E273C1A|nr:esterase FE4-like isoform X2 [Melitaea cinxia]
MLLLVLLCAVAASAQDAPRVNITQGVIVGARVIDGDYLSFYGIHYGAPPTGENRFKAPKEAPPYPGDFHAVNSDVICAQPSSRGLIGEENCLVVNIHTKNLTTPKPVLVWLEGEEYETTSKTLYSYKELILEGLVVVTMNYRLSIFGFLCLGVPEAPGNAGLKDVVLGLKWIQANIAAFGGDPNKVTLLGHGSGGAMVDLMTMSPLAKGLFHNVMVLSGSALAPWAIAYDPIGYATKLGAKLEYTRKNPSELAKLLSTTDINVLSSVLSDSVFYNNTPLFAPCIENAKLNPNETFLSEAPIKLLRSGNYIDVPYVAGFTDREGTIRAKEAALENWLPTMNVKFENFLTVDLAFKTDKDKLNASKVIREFYFRQRPINMETIEDFLDYMGDILILVPVTRGVVERALTSNSSVRLFEFAFRGTQDSDWPYPQIPLNGVKHGGILNYLFNFDLKENASNARSSIIKRVVHFVQTGSPQPRNTLEWNPISKTLMHMLYFSGGEVQPQVTVFNEQLVANRNRERTDFWSKVFNEYYKSPMALSSASSLFSFGIMVMITQIVIKIL